MIVRYSDTDFEFEPKGPGELTGHLKLDEEKEKLLAALIASQEDDWYLDSNGERLPSDKLFLLSPWSIETSEGHVKLLNRYLNIKTGEVQFSSPNTYGGEFFSFHLRCGQ